MVKEMVLRWSLLDRMTIFFFTNLLEVVKTFELLHLFVKYQRHMMEQEEQKPNT